MAELALEIGRLRHRLEAQDERVRELLDSVNRSTGILSGLAVRLETVAAGKAAKEDLKADAVIVRAIRTELCKRGDAFLTDTQDLGPVKRTTGQWRPPAEIFRKKGPRGRGR